MKRHLTRNANAKFVKKAKNTLARLWRAATSSALVRAAAEPVLPHRTTRALLKRDVSCDRRAGTCMPTSLRRTAPARPAPQQRRTLKSKCSWNLCAAA